MWGWFGGGDLGAYRMYRRWPFVRLLIRIERSVGVELIFAKHQPIRYMSACSKFSNGTGQTHIKIVYSEKGRRGGGGCR